MKTLSLLLLSLVMFCGFASAQIPTGTYAYTDIDREHQTLVFYKNGRIYFDLITNGCLTYNLIGVGTYQLDKERILINPDLSPRPTYHLTTTPAQPSDMLCFYITDSLKNPVIGASVCITKAGQTVVGVISDTNGIARLLRNRIHQGDTVTISSFGFYFYKVSYVPDLSAYQHVTMLTGLSDAGYVDYLTNKKQGYPYKLTANSIKINFKDSSHCGNPDVWVEFKKVNEPAKTSASRN